MNPNLLNEIQGKKWFDAVGYCVHDLGRHNFSLQEFLSIYRPVLQNSRPNNSTIDSTVRRVMQELRDAEVIEFIDNAGNYRCADYLDKPLVKDIDLSGFKLELQPKPNAPAHELVWREGQQAFTSSYTKLHKEKIGAAGEVAVLAAEIDNLTKAGRSDLAKQVEHVSKTEGDNAGFDIRSFDTNAQEKWIEVKTTTGHASRRFHISENQLVTSELEPKKYWLYRLYHFQTGSKTASYYQMQGALRIQLDLHPTEYLALPN